jgi:AbrB family looped-hinge helix DNA binding protein
MKEEKVRIGKRFQIVLPKSVRKSLGVGEGDKLIITVKEGEALLRPLPRNYSKYMLGLHKELWKSVDVDEYIKEERKKWKEKE